MHNKERAKTPSPEWAKVPEAKRNPSVFYDKEEKPEGARNCRCGQRLPPWTRRPIRGCGDRVKRV